MMRRPLSLACRGCSSAQRIWQYQSQRLLLNRRAFSTSAPSSSQPRNPSTPAPSPAATSAAASTPSPSPSSSAPPHRKPRSPRPFRILGLQQVAIGSASLPALSSLYTELLGIPRVSTFTSQSENVKEDILTLGPPASPLRVELDLMQPLQPDASPRPHIPPLNHIGLWVSDLAAAVRWLGEEAGLRFTPGGVRKGAAGHDVCFIHPKGDAERGLRGGEGVLIELVQAPADVIAAYEAAGRRS